MERKIFWSGILILVMGTALFLFGSTTLGLLILAVGALDLIAVIFWPQITGALSHRKQYSLGNQAADSVLIISGIALTAITGMFVFLALTAGGASALWYRYSSSPEPA